MKLHEARNLKPGDLVFDSNGSAFPFVALDEDDDLIVEYKHSMGGTIYLIRENCSCED